MQNSSFTINAEYASYVKFEIKHDRIYENFCVFTNEQISRGQENCEIMI